MDYLHCSYDKARDLLLDYNIARTNNQPGKVGEIKRNMVLLYKEQQQSEFWVLRSLLELELRFFYEANLEMKTDETQRRGHEMWSRRLLLSIWNEQKHQFSNQLQIVIKGACPLSEKFAARYV